MPKKKTIKKKPKEKNPFMESIRELISENPEKIIFVRKGKKYKVVPVEEKKEFKLAILKLERVNRILEYIEELQRGKPKNYRILWSQSLYILFYELVPLMGKKELHDLELLFRKMIKKDE